MWEGSCPGAEGWTRSLKHLLCAGWVASLCWERVDGRSEGPSSQELKVLTSRVTRCFPEYPCQVCCDSTLLVSASGDPMSKQCQQRGILLTQVTASPDGSVSRHSWVQGPQKMSPDLFLSECLVSSSLPWLSSFSSSGGLWKLQAHGEVAEKGFRLRLKSSFCHCLALQRWGSCFTSQCFSFLICTFLMGLS